MVVAKWSGDTDPLLRVFLITPRRLIKRPNFANASRLNTYVESGGILSRIRE